MADRIVSATRTVNAPPEKIFELLTDPAKHSLIDGSGTVQAARGSGQKLTLGSEFGMDMRMGVPYRISNKVVEYEEGRLIAWRHFGRHRWRWQLEPAGDGKTRVTETFDYSTAPAGALYPLLKFPERNRDGIEKTLDRLTELFPDSPDGQPGTSG